MPLSKELQNAYQKTWLKNRRMAFLQGKVCVSCGGQDDLEIDHIDPTKKLMPVASIWSRKESVRQEELKKCQVLCKKCHLLKTSQWRKSQRKPLVHGTKHAYGVWDCKCRLCKDAHNIDNRARAEARAAKS